MPLARTLHPAEVVELAYQFADALKAANEAATALWEHLPSDRQPAFDAADVDTVQAEALIRELADRWQDEIDNAQAEAEQPDEQQASLTTMGGLFNHLNSHFTGGR